jgi:hypothetical protein
MSTALSPSKLLKKSAPNDDHETKESWWLDPRIKNARSGDGANQRCAFATQKSIFNSLLGALPYFPEVNHVGKRED